MGRPITKLFFRLLPMLVPALVLAQPAALDPGNRPVPPRRGAAAPARATSKAAEGATFTRAVPFVALTPCRLADTRGNGFGGEFGPPSLSPGGARIFPAVGHCGVPSDAAAVSFNLTVVRTQGSGYLTVSPQGAPRPATSTLNYSAGQIVANNAVVGLGVGGGIAVEISGQGTDLIIDVNGYYGGTLVNSLNGLSGDLTIAEGENMKISSVGGVLTLNAASVPGPVGPQGPQGVAGPAGPQGPAGAGGQFQSSHDLGDRTGTHYMSVLGGWTHTEEHGPAIALIPKPCTLTRILVFVTSSPLSETSEDFTVRLGTSFQATEGDPVSDIADTPLTCSIAAGSQACTATAAIPVEAGTLVDLKVVINAGRTPVAHDAIVALVCD